jgi:hypothetical protein
MAGLIVADTWALIVYLCPGSATSSRHHHTWHRRADL